MYKIFCPLLSDSHNAVSLDFTISYPQGQIISRESNKNDQPKKLWRSHKTDIFVNNLDLFKIEELSNISLQLQTRQCRPRRY